MSHECPEQLLAKVGRCESRHLTSASRMARECEEVSWGIQKFSLESVVLLEGTEIQWTWTQTGIYTQKGHFECLHALLLASSPLYTQKFHQKVCSKLLPI